MRMILMVILLFSFLPPTGARAEMPAPVAQHVLNATLTLRSADGRDRFLGSGFVYGVGNRVITNAHVVGKAETVTVVTQAGQRQTARVISIDTVRDLAVLSLAEPLETVLISGKGKPAPGQVVYASGAPLEASFTLTIGVVSALDRQIDPTQPIGYVQHSAPVNPGSSGGPLVDAEGHVVGINTRIADGSRYFVGIAYAVPTDVLDAFLQNGTSTGRPAPGVRLRPLSPRIRAALGYEGPGVLVEEVHPNTPAADAGLLAGDILVRLEGQDVNSPGDLAFALAQESDTLTMQVRRGDVMATFVVSRVSPMSILVPESGQVVPRKSTYKLTDMGLILDPDGQIRAVVSQGAGFFAGLSAGDQIVAINGVLVADLAPDWPKDYTFDAAILMRIMLPDGATKHYVLDPWDPGSGLRLASGANVLDSEVVSFD